MEAYDHNILLGALEPMHIQIRMAESLPEAPSVENEYFRHMHNAYELYFNLSGDVSFMVEDAIYPIQPGSVILTAPQEYHQCIYHSNAVHKHFCIFIRPAIRTELFRRFFDHSNGHSHLIQLSNADTARMASLCTDLCRNQTDLASAYACFFSILSILNTTSKSQTKTAEPRILPDVSLALAYLSTVLPKAVAVSDIAKNAFISVNTLERHFRETFGLTPNQYVLQRRLMIAAKLLRREQSVQEVANACGFSSCSRFISAFRHQYGMTPLAYKKLVADIPLPHNAVLESEL